MADLLTKLRNLFLKTVTAPEDFGEQLLSRKSFEKEGETTLTMELGSPG